MGNRLWGGQRLDGTGADVTGDGFLSTADINDDGVIDAHDIRAFAKLHNLPLLPEFDELLSRLERAERKHSRR